MCLSVELCLSVFKGLKTVILRKYLNSTERPVSVGFLAKSLSLPLSPSATLIRSLLCPRCPLSQNVVGISMGTFSPCPPGQGFYPLNPTHFSLISFSSRLALPELLWAS